MSNTDTKTRITLPLVSGRRAENFSAIFIGDYSLDRQDDDRSSVPCPTCGTPLPSHSLEGLSVQAAKLVSFLYEHTPTGFSDEVARAVREVEAARGEYGP